jgi:O-antigen/teichoic acid export membrane protein
MAAPAARRDRDSAAGVGVTLKPGSGTLDPGVTSAGRLWARVRAAWYRHQDMLRNLVALLATTGLTSALGFLYWNIAARLFSQQAVGYGTAAVSAMTFISTVGVSGLGMLLIGDLPKRQNRAGLISAAMLTAAGGSIVLALIFVLIVPHLTTHYNDIAGSIGGASLFCAGVALTAMSVVFDLATIGMQRGSLQLIRNLAFVVIKLLTLVGAAVLVHYSTGIGLFASWVVAIPAALLLIGVRLLFARARILARPDWQVLRSLARVLFAHNWLNLALQVRGLITPVIVAAILAPAINAAYYVAMTICTGLFILPMHLSTALFAATSNDHKLVARKLRFAARVSLALGIPAMVVLGVGAHFILSLFGRGYAQAATLPMVLIVLNYLPTLPNSFYISVSRATGRISQAAVIMSIFAVIEVAGVVIGCVRYGLVGMAAASLGLSVLEAMVTGPAVLRAALGSGRHRRGESRAGVGLHGVSTVSTRLVSSAADMALARDQQLAGLAMLISMATPVNIAAVTDHGHGGLRLLAKQQE